MIRTSNYTNLTASITGRGKRGLFALGEVAQKRLYAEHVPSSTGELGSIFSLLSLALAAVGVPSNFPRMSHSAAGNQLKPLRKAYHGPNVGKAPIGVIKIDRHKSDRLC